MKTAEEIYTKFWDRFERGRWEMETYDLMADCLRPGDLFVDVGAWIGPLCVWADDLQARAIAIEPHPRAIRELKEVAPDAEIWEGAVGLVDGECFITDKLDSMNEVVKVGGRKVPCWTLETILDGRKPRMVNMDIEGFEMVLLPSVAPYLASLGTTLVVSLHTDVPPREWFKDFMSVRIPHAPRHGPTGRSRLVVARP